MTEITGSQGFQVGDHNIQVNVLFGGQQPRGSIVAGNIPQAPPAFQPRADLMARLRAAGPGVSVVRAVTGMRGVGKTQLAAAYANECIDGGWRLVAWVNAEDTPAILNGLAVVATRLGMDNASRGNCFTASPRLTPPRHGSPYRAAGARSRSRGTPSTKPLAGWPIPRC